MIKEKMQTKKQIEKSFHGNIERVRNLLLIHSTFVANGSGRKAGKDLDVLRAAVVMLHSSLEELLRSLQRLYLLNNLDSDYLKTLGFPSGKFRNSIDKVDISYLLMRKDKSIRELIEEVIDLHLVEISYGNIGSIKKALNSMNLHKLSDTYDFKNLNKIATRRHNIVHNADRVKSQGRGNHAINTISTTQLKTWINSVADFGHQVLQSVEIRKYL